jgi:fructokinase
MMTEHIHSIAVCFGEILWDMLPDGPQPGGAPLNVAYHLNKLGVDAGIISRVGNDENGRKLAGLLSSWGIKKDLLQTDAHYSTSEVIATLNDHHEVTYEIVFPVAWDFISKNEGMPLPAADYFVYGSLASRNEVTRETLFRHLETDAIKVFDINLRPPFYKEDLLAALLQKADIVKFNEAELQLAVSLFRKASGGEQEDVHFIRNHFGVREVIVTKGAEGASYYNQQESYHTPGCKITVADTIGSGDSFLAAFIANHAQQKKPQEIMQNAIAMGAFIATKKGGCPDYDISEYHNFRDSLTNSH